MRFNFKYFSKVEWTLWISSMAFIIVSFYIFGKGDDLSLIASLVGVSVF